MERKSVFGVAAVGLTSLSVITILMTSATSVVTAQQQQQQQYEFVTKWGSEG